MFMIIEIEDVNVIVYKNMYLKFILNKVIIYYSYVTIFYSLALFSNSMRHLYF